MYPSYRVRKSLVITSLIVACLFIIYGLMYFTIKKPVLQRDIGDARDTYGCISSAGYSWCEEKKKCLRIFEEFCPDAVSAIVDSIKNESGVVLLPSGETTFTWFVSENDDYTEVKITGIRYSADGIHGTDYHKMEKYMNENFTVDEYNGADGVGGYGLGYYNNSMVCQLSFGPAEWEEAEDGAYIPAGDTVNVHLECGYLNKK